jgi:hypothetical protein
MHMLEFVMWPSCVAPPLYCAEQRQRGRSVWWETHRTSLQICACPAHGFHSELLLCSVKIKRGLHELTFYSWKSGRQWLDDKDYGVLNLYRIERYRLWGILHAASRDNYNAADSATVAT